MRASDGPGGGDPRPAGSGEAPPDRRPDTPDPPDPPDPPDKESRRTDGWRNVGEDPDERFSFANERTFLAWNRTALALVTAGLAITQVLPKLSITGGRRMIGLPLIALGIVIAYTSYRQWMANERALRLKERLPPQRLPLLLSSVITLTAVIAFVLAAVGGSR